MSAQHTQEQQAVSEYIGQLEAQRDELAAALRNAMVWVDLFKDEPAEAMRQQARAALAKVPT